MFFKRKEVKNLDGNLSSFQKFELFFGRNAFLFFSVAFVAILLSTFTAFFVVKSSYKERSRLEGLVDKLTNQVLVATPDGRVVPVVLNKAQNLLNRYVRSCVLNYFILDRLSFLNLNGDLIPLEVSKDTGVKGQKETLLSFLNKFPKVRPLLDFVDGNDPKSIGAFYAYLTYLYSLARYGELPDFIEPVSVEKEEFVKVGLNGFNYHLTVLCKISYVNPAGKVVMGQGRISFSLSGIFDPEQGTQYNPFGMLVKKLTVKYITVGGGE